MERMARESSPRILDKITRCNCVHMYYIICIYVDFCIGIYIDVNMVVWIPIQCLDRVYVHIYIYIYKYICFVMSPIVGSGECMSKRTCRAIYIYIYIYIYIDMNIYMCICIYSKRGCFIV